MLLQVGVLIAGFYFLHATKMEVLSGNFFENLQAHPKLLIESDLSDRSRQFVERQIDNFVGLVMREEKSRKKKRSLLQTFTKGIYLLNGVEKCATIPARFPVDITLFRQGSRWFAAALESPTPKNNADSLVVYKFADEAFVEESRVAVVNGVKLATVAAKNRTLIAVAENDAPKNTFHDKSGIYQFDALGLVKIQSIDMHYASDIVMWRIHNDVYMSVAQFMSNKTGNIHYEIELPIYKWLGGHFDLVQIIPSKAIANFKDNRGQTRIYSQIYKYDYHGEKFELYQNILTRACNDIKVFSLSHDRRKDVFLVVANSHEKDFDGNINYETDSIIYKLVDNYFIPFQSIQLNGVEEWLPLQGPDQEFVLVASSRFDGLRFFQYDGWEFTEVSQKTTELLRGSGITSIRSADFRNVTTLVVSNKNNNGNVGNVFRLNFTYQNTLNEMYDDMMGWCDDGLEKIEEMTNAEVFDAVLGEAQRADIDEKESQELRDAEIEEINSRIASLNSLLDGIDYGDGIAADQIIFNNLTLFDNLNATTINSFQTREILDNILDIEEGFELGEVDFASIKIEGDFTPTTINRQDPSSLVYRNDNLTLEFLTVGKVVSSGVEIGGTLNGVVVDDGNLLMRTGDQQFSKPLVVRDVTVDRIFARSLKGNDLATMRLWDEGSVTVESMETLTVENLMIGGYINDVDVPTLDRYALRKTGDQRITSLYTFDTLRGANLDVRGEISGKTLSKLVPIDGGEYSIDSDLFFSSGLFVNDLKVTRSINGILVHDGKLDVLLKNHPEEQEISGEKIFDDVRVHRAIYLRGRINSEDMERMNPVVTLKDSIVLDGDRTVTGNVRVENLVSADDVITPDGAHSLSKLEADGLRLTAKEIQPRLHFAQQLNVDEIFVDQINGREVGSFVVTGSEDTQIVKGAKTFTGDLTVTGDTNALKIDDVEVEELENKVLKVDGDQIVTGKHHVKNLIAEKIESRRTLFDNKKLSTVKADANRTNSETVYIDDDYNVESVKAKTITVKGLVNDLFFDEMVNDTVTKDTDRLVRGHKYFGEKLTTVELSVNKGFDVPSEIDELALAGPFEINNVKIENLYFEKEFNGVDRHSFGKNETQEDGCRTVEGEHVFNTLTIFGGAYIASNQINGIDVRELSENSVKLDEPFEFNSVTFESDVISNDTVLLHGHVENLDFDNAIFANTESEVTFFDDKTFKSNLTINGTVSFDGFVNDFNFTQFCKFAWGEVRHKNLTLDGDAFFVRGPDVAHVNGLSVQTINEEAWFGDEDSVLTGSLELGDVTFTTDVTVGGFVDNISLTHLHENYFSKSKDQNVTAMFTFEGDLVFESDVTVPEMTLGGEVNRLDLDEFVHTALLNDHDQVFESVVFLENCSVQNLTGEFLVNGLDLDKDVMRYDKVNMVTGAKHFDNLSIKSLKLDKNVKIQSVDVLEWFKNSVLTTTGSNITGTKSFKSATFRNGLQLDGNLNGLRFDSGNVMLKSVPQEITGVKIIQAPLRDPVVFKGIKLKGRLNGVDIVELINNQAYKNQDNIFKSRLNFFNNITVDNLEVKKSFRGVNMSELITNVTNLGALNNLVDQYNKLLNMAGKLEDSIGAQAYFLHHYKVVQTIPGVSNSRKVLWIDGAYRIGVLVEDSGVKMDLYCWNPQDEQFTKDASLTFKSDHLVYVDQVLMGQYLYMERSDGLGEFAPVSSSADNTVTIHTNTTTSTTSFALPSNTACTLFTYSDCNPKIFCAKGQSVHLLQTLDTVASKAASITVDTLYLVIVSKPSGEESRTELWRFDNRTNAFEMQQSMFEAHPKSVATASYNGFHYLAIASGHLHNAIYSGRVEIRRFDPATRAFLPWQSLELDAPVQVEFATLPSDELVLYVLTDNPTEPLLVFRYEGIAGFQLTVTGSTLPEIVYLNQFLGGVDRHFIVAQSRDEINVIEAIFKGEKVN